LLNVDGIVFFVL